MKKVWYFIVFLGKSLFWVVAAPLAGFVWGMFATWNFIDEDWYFFRKKIGK